MKQAIMKWGARLVTLAGGAIFGYGVWGVSKFVVIGGILVLVGVILERD